VTTCTRQTLAADQPKPAKALTRALASAIATVALVAGSLAITASAAQAATSRCTYAMGVRLGTDIYEIVPASVAPGDIRSWHCYMNFGDGVGGSNYGVKTLQESLNVCYKLVIGNQWPLDTDGKFGGHTRTALIRVQRAEHIVADGGYGPQTAAAMLHKTDAITPYGIFITCNRIPAGA
jgi:peptidoglycan hydrolase-like protein with peptidoglycan-binding domain